MRNMKKIFLNKMFVAVAMIFAASMFGACSSSSDDNNTQKEEEKKDEPTGPTSGTLYMYAVVDSAGRVWTDCTSTLSGTQSIKKFSTDSTTVDELTNAKLVSAIKKSFARYNKLADKLAPVLDEKLPLLVDSVALTTFPSSNSFQLNFSLKPDSEKGKELTYFVDYCFIDNLGNLSIIETVDMNWAVYDKEGDISELIEVMSGGTKTTAEVSKMNSGFKLE